MNRHRPALCGAALGIILLLLTGCSLLAKPGAAHPDPGHSDPSSATYDGPGEPQLEATEVWGPEAFSGSGVVALGRDEVILTGDDVPAIAIGRDGDERWRLPAKVPLTKKIPAATVIMSDQAVPAEEQSVVAGSYTWDWCQANQRACLREDKLVGAELGVAGFSAADGHPLWTSVLVPADRHLPGAEQDHGTIKVEFVTDAAVVVTRIPGSADAERQTETIALDPGTGKKLWSEEGFRADRPGDGVIFGHQLESDTKGPGAGDGELSVLDARSGRELWQSPDRGTWLTPGTDERLPIAAAGFGVFYPASDAPLGTGPAATVVDLADGKTQPFEVAGLVGQGDDDPFYAWTAIGDASTGTVLSQPLTSAEPRAGRETFDTSMIVGTTGGYLWARPVDNTKAAATTAYDRTGGRRLGPVPGLPEMINNDWLITRTETDQLSVYRLG